MPHNIEEHIHLHKILGVKPMPSLQIMINATGVSGGSWVRAGGYFLFPGTEKYGSVSRIKVIIDHNSDTADIRIFDTTNNQEIAVIYNLPSLLSIQEFSVFNNLSFGEAVWEFQVQESGSGQVNIYTMVMDF